MFGAYVRENRKVVIALAVYTAVFAFIFWLYRLPLGAVGYAALVCLFLLLVWLAVDYRRFAVRLRLLRRLEQEITLSTEQLPEPDGALEAPKTLCIRDTGIGIAPEDLPRVFEKGFTGCNGRTDKRATGIGLYLCRRILEKLGHTIAITSTVGEGTTVRIGLQQDALEVE